MPKVAALPPPIQLLKHLPRQRPLGTRLLTGSFKRAQGCLRFNELNTARLLLMRASEEGHADPAFALAQIYDPSEEAAA